MATNECSRCGSNTKVGFINCRHATVCLKCAKPMAETKEACSVCGVVVTHVYQEYPLRLCSADDGKKYFAAAFQNGSTPDFANDHQWSLVKQSQSSDANAIDAEVLNKDPWILENQAGIKYEGNRVVPSEQSEYYFLRKEDDGYFVAIPCDGWFRFTRVPPSGTQQLTTEQAEEQMEKQREQVEETIQKHSKHLRTGQIKPTSTREHWDHNSSCSDDEDVVDGDNESIHVPSAIKDFQENDNEAFLSNAGRDLNNLLRKFDKSDGKGSGSEASTP